MGPPTYADFHVHTHLSPCGKPGATAAALIECAGQKGLAAIGFADHLTPEPVAGCPFYDAQRLDMIGTLREEIVRASPREELEILVGVEADYTLAGTSCIDAQMLSLADHVVCASSHFHLPAAPQAAEDTPRAKAALMLRLAREALAMPGVSIWAHPFDCSTMRPLVPILATVAQDELAELVALAGAHKVAIEVNGGPARHEDYREATARFFLLARDMGARFTVTADAHHPDDLERLDLALAWAQAMGIKGQDLLCAEELRDRQERKLRNHALGGSPDPKE